MRGACLFCYSLLCNACSVCSVQFAGSTDLLQAVTSDTPDHFRELLRRAGHIRFHHNTPLHACHQAFSQSAVTASMCAQRKERAKREAARLQQRLAQAAAQVDQVAPVPDAHQHADEQHVVLEQPVNGDGALPAAGGAQPVDHEAEAVVPVVHHVPAQPEPVKQELVHQEPVNQEPAQSESVAPEPVHPVDPSKVSNHN